MVGEGAGVRVTTILSMPDPPELIMSYNIFKALYDATLCSFILLLMKQVDRPLDAHDLTRSFSLNKKKSISLLEVLQHFQYIVPGGDSRIYTITRAGAELISTKPPTSPFQYDPTFDVEGDRIPSYIAYDILPLRLYTYHLGKGSNGQQD